MAEEQGLSFFSKPKLMLPYTPPPVEIQRQWQRSRGFIISPQDFNQHLQVWQHPYGQTQPRNKPACYHQPPRDRFSFLCKQSESILLETTAQAHTNIYKKMHAFSTYTQILHFCVLCFPISCAQNLSPKNFYLRYQNPRFALSAGEFFTLSSLCHPQWRRCQFMLSLLNHVKKQPGLQLLWDRNRSLCKYLCTHRKSQRV